MKLTLPRIPAPPIVPTARTLVLLALLAPLAVVVAATAPGDWVVAPAAGLALLLVVLIDGWLAGSLTDLRYYVPADVEVGQPAMLRVDAIIERDGDAAEAFGVEVGQGGGWAHLPKDAMLVTPGRPGRSVWLPGGIPFPSPPT